MKEKIRLSEGDMLLSKLLQGLEYRLCGAFAGTVVSRPFSDSRVPVQGGLFICIRGQRTDGHLYAAAAVQRGARAVVADRVIMGVPTVLVRDTRYAAAVIWNNFYERPGEGMRLFGITGTCAKTSVAQFLASCLRESGAKVGVIGTLGCYANGKRIKCAGSEKCDVAAAMTTPDPAYLYAVLSEFKKRGVTHTVMEVSSHAILQKKVDALSFDLTAFTNLSEEHLDAHGTMEEYFRVKASFVSRGGGRVVNADDPYGKRLCERVHSIGVSRSMLENVCVTGEGVSYDLLFCKERIRIKSSVCGDFTVDNTALAAVCALSAGVPARCVSRGIAAVSSVSGRMERVEESREAGFSVIIDYAHTPEALRKVLEALREQTAGRLICVFGCGGERDRSKRPLMGRVAEEGADAVIVTGDNPRGESAISIIRDIIKGMKKNNATVIPSRREAIFAAVSIAERGDCVLLAGKGHERYEIVNNKKREFDERKIVREALKARFGN